MTEKLTVETTLEAEALRALAFFFGGGLLALIGLWATFGFSAVVAAIGLFLFRTGVRKVRALWEIKYLG